MMQKRQNRRQDGVDVGKATRDDCHWFRQNSATWKNWNDDVINFSGEVLHGNFKKKL